MTTGQQRVYLDDTYAFTRSTVALDVLVEESGAWITPQDCIFHPRGGGQPDDIATVDGMPVLRLSVLDGRVAALVPNAHHLTVGSLIETAVDAPTRLHHAALHTAGHLIDSLGRGMGLTHIRHSHVPGEARVEFGLEGRDDVDAVAHLIADGVEEAIHADRAVRASWQGDRRTVSIDSLGEDPCGGTHVRSLGALDAFVLRSVKRKGTTLKVGYDVEYRHG